MRLFIYLFIISFLLSSNIDTVYIDTSISKIEWIGNKVSGSHNGMVAISGGYVLRDKDSFVGGEVIVNMESISVEDIEHSKWNKALVDHLKNEDFFDVKNFPISTLKILSSKKSLINDKLNSNVVISGDLTIKGITNKVLIHSYIDFDKNTSIGELIIDRTKWGIKYGSSSFFDDLGDRAIYNDFILNFHLFPKE